MGILPILYLIVMMIKNEDPTSHIEICPNCNKGQIIVDDDTGEKVCNTCGIVSVEKVLSTGPEYRVFNLQEGKDRKRAGAGYNINLHDNGLSTVISGNRDYTGKLLDDETRYKMFRLKRQDNRSKLIKNHSKNLSVALSEIDRIASKIDIPESVRKNAAFLYRKALDKELIRGRSIDAFVAACVYASCRIIGVPRPLYQVSNVSKCKQPEVAMIYRLLIKELNLKPPVDGPYKFIPGIASKLGLSLKTERLAADILKKADERNELVGKNPRGMAAAALYMACKEVDEKLVQSQISSAAGTSEVTIRNRMKGLLTALEELDVSVSDLLE